MWCLNELVLFKNITEYKSSGPVHNAKLKGFIRVLKNMLADQEIIKLVTYNI